MQSQSKKSSMASRHSDERTKEFEVQNKMELITPAKDEEAGPPPMS